MLEVVVCDVSISSVSTIGTMSASLQEKMLFPCAGSAELMTVKFREVDTFNLWVGSSLLHSPAHT